jgi:hypothetical protein
MLADRPEIVPGLAIQADKQQLVFTGLIMLVDEQKLFPLYWSSLLQVWSCLLLIPSANQQCPLFVRSADGEELVSSWLQLWLLVEVGSGHRIYAEGQFPHAGLPAE